MAPPTVTPSTVISLALGSRPLIQFPLLQTRAMLMLNGLVDLILEASAHAALARIPSQALITCLLLEQIQPSEPMAPCILLEGCGTPEAEAKSLRSAERSSPLQGLTHRTGGAPVTESSRLRSPIRSLLLAAQFPSLTLWPPAARRREALKTRQDGAPGRVSCLTHHIP